MGGLLPGSLGAGLGPTYQILQEGLDSTLFLNKQSCKAAAVSSTSALSGSPLDKAFALLLSLARFLVGIALSNY